MWQMHDKEYANRLAQPPDERYRFFIETAVEKRMLWILASNEGFRLLGDDEGHEIVPVWPHPRLAAACAVGDWAADEPRPIELSAWLERWVPHMIAHHQLVAVFPVRTAAGRANGPVVTPEQLRDDLEALLAEYDEGPIPGVDTNIYDRPTEGYKRRGMI